MMQRETKGLKLGHHNERPVTDWVEIYERTGMNDNSLRTGSCDYENNSN
jgi:hypothetical protein